MAGSHVYPIGGFFTITVTVIDNHLAADSDTAATAVAGAGLHDGVLVIVGTAGEDDVRISLVAGVIRLDADFDEDDSGGWWFGHEYGWSDGGPDADVLVGGFGADRLIGGVGNDILIAGELSGNHQSTNVATQLNGQGYTFDVLRAIGAAWAASRTQDADLASNNGSNDEDIIDEAISAERDFLTGNAGADWFILNLTNDSILDLRTQLGDRVTNTI